MHHDAALAEMAEYLACLLDADPFVDEFQQSVGSHLQAAAYSYASSIGKEVAEFLGISLLEAHIARLHNLVAVGNALVVGTENEIEVANGYIKDMCERVLDIPYEEHAILDGPGVHLSDGVQAVAYARNRFVGNSDYTRTQRQRYVIQQMVKKIKSLSSTQLLGFVQKVLPLVTHNLPENEIWSLVWDAPSILKYDIVMDRVPYDGMYSEIDVGGQGMLVPDWNETISQMHRTIYGDGSISGNEDNDMDTSKYELTDEYMEMTGGTGTLFPEGFTGELATERQTEQTGKSESLPKQRP